METTDEILKAMAKAAKPVNAGLLVELTGIERKEIDKGMKKLKAEGKIKSPKMCYWEPAE